ncbi:MAG: hypothetical protein IJ105_01270 [Bacilli bacterium]|nr:hypothetical protein [Bacilli bacterium]
MNSVNSFTMYFDYFNLIDTLPLRDKATLLVAINDYMFKDIEPKLLGHNQAIFNTLKNQLNLSKSNSKRRTKKETETEPKENQKETETELQENKTSILSFKFYIYNFKFINNNDLLISKIEEWINYKKQRKDKPYTEIGLNTLLKIIDKAVEEHGTDKVIDLIEECIANNYQGIIFEKLKKGQPYPNSSSNQQWEETKREFMKND